MQILIIDNFVYFYHGLEELLVTLICAIDAISVGKMQISLNLLQFYAYSHEDFLLMYAVIFFLASF